MRLLRLAFRREVAAPVLAVSFASAVCLVMLTGRILFTGRLAYGLLAWNLFLAWLPLLFSLLASEKYESSSIKDWRFLSLAGAWLLFFPNAPYIFTDLFHLTARFYEHFWLDLVLILLFALTGLVLGFLSLYLMQSIVSRTFGRLAGWLFIGAAAWLGSFGIYLGRFLRFNSWDVVFKPYELYQGIGWASASFARPGSVAFLALFATFVFVSYLMLYALTHLQPAQVLPVHARTVLRVNAEEIA